MEVLREDHITSMVQVTEDEGWGYDETELAWLIAHTRGCGRVVVGENDAIRGAALGFPWGRVDFIGGVIVRPEHRGQGLGAEVCAHVMKALRAHSCETLRLLATPKAIGLYERLGFQGEQEVRLWEGHAPPAKDDPWPVIEDVGPLVRLERNALGLDRRAYLEDVVRARPDLTAWNTNPDVGVVTRTAGFPVIGPSLASPGGRVPARAMVDAVAGRLGKPAQVIGFEDGLRPCWATRTGKALLMRHGPVIGDRALVTTGGGEEVG